jgi:hypothetical protein
MPDCVRRRALSNRSSLNRSSMSTSLRSLLSIDWPCRQCSASSPSSLSLSELVDSRLRCRQRIRYRICRFRPDDGCSSLLWKPNNDDTLICLVRLAGASAAAVAVQHVRTVGGVRLASTTQHRINLPPQFRSETKLVSQRRQKSRGKTKPENRCSICRYSGRCTFRRHYNRQSPSNQTATPPIKGEFQHKHTTKSNDLQLSLSMQQ